MLTAMRRALCLPELYAWCNQTLLDHCLGTATQFERRFKDRLAFWTKSRIPEVWHLRDEMDGIRFIEFAVAMHDIGKGLDVYQDSIKIKPCNKFCKRSCQFQPSFRWHEAFSVILFQNIVRKILVRLNLDQEKRLALQNPSRFCEIAILAHHQAMRDFSEIEKGARELPKRGKIVLRREAIDISHEVAKSILGNDEAANLVKEAMQECSNEDLYGDMWNLSGRMMFEKSRMPKLNALICGPLVLCDNYDASKRGSSSESPLMREIKRFFNKR